MGNSKYIRFLSWNTSSFLIIIVVSIASLPIYFNTLSAVDFAIVSIIWSTVAMSTVLDLGFGRSLTRELGAITNESEHKNYKPIASSGIAAAFIYSIVVSILVHAGLEVYFNLDESKFIVDSTVLYLVSLTVFSTLLGNSFTAIFEGMHLIRFVSLIRTIFSVLFIAAPAFLMAMSLIADSTAVILMIAIIKFAQLFTCIILSYKLRIFSIVNVSSHNLKLLFDQGKWLSFSSIISLAMTHSDRFILGYYSQPIALRGYLVASELIQRGVGILAIISVSLFPLISGNGNNDSKVSNINKAFILNLLIGIVGIIGGSILIEQFLNIWLGYQEVSEIANLFRIMLIGWFASGFGQLYLATIHSTGNTKTPAILHLAEATVIIPLMIYAVYNYGVYGAASVWALRAIADAILLKLISDRI